MIALSKNAVREATHAVDSFCYEFQFTAIDKQVRKNSKKAYDHAVNLLVDALENRSLAANCLSQEMFATYERVINPKNEKIAGGNSFFEKGVAVDELFADFLWRADANGKCCFVLKLELGKISKADLPSVAEIVEVVFNIMSQENNKNCPYLQIAFVGIIHTCNAVTKTIFSVDDN